MAVFAMQVDFPRLPFKGFTFDPPSPGSILANLRNIRNRFSPPSNMARRSPRIGKRTARRLDFTGSRTRTRTRRKTRTNRATTFQHDATFMYGRKRAPRRLRRRAKRAQARYTHHLVSGLGQKSAVFQSVANRTLTPTSLHDAQDVYTVGMYGGITASATWGDLAEIAANENMLTKTGKVYFKSAVLETQIRNNSESGILVVDVYEVVARRDGYNEPGSDWALALSAQNTVSSMTHMTQNELNGTPFDAPGFGSSWLVRNKTRYRISPGLSVYLQRRDAKDYKFDTSRFEYDTGASSTRIKMFANMSEGFIIVARNSEIDTSVPKGDPIDYDVYATKTYHYAVQAYEMDEVGVQ